eukprot:15850401-Heterocapsa_arctica.AAC.1
MRTLYNDILKVATVAKMHSAATAPGNVAAPVRDRKLECATSDPATHDTIQAVRRRMSVKQENAAFDPIGDPAALPRAGGKDDDDDAAMLEPQPLAPMGEAAAQQV